MEGYIKAVKDYLYSTMQVRINLEPWQAGRELPFFLQDLYEFYTVVLFKQPCVLMIAKLKSAVTPTIIKKHWEMVQQKCQCICIFIQEGMSAHNRARLIDHHVPFIIPGNQMYLPDLGIDLREHFQKIRTGTIKAFRPATQAFIIHALVHGVHEQVSPAIVAQKLGYSRMTMTRVFDELQAAGIGQIVYEGKERLWCYEGVKRRLWEEALPLMKSPIKYTTWLVDNPPPLLKDTRAGLDALSTQSMIQPPHLHVYAISQDRWDTLKRHYDDWPSPDGASCEVQIWNYEPLTKDKMVDPFSLYLSLITDADERTELALEEMMEKIQW